MTILDKNIVLKKIHKKFNCSLSVIKGKQIMFRGNSDGKSLILCTPSSKLHPRGMGWFDLTIKQVEILDKAEIAILAVRLEGSKIYYLNFKRLRRLMTTENLH
jgi:hypothetical protein